ncbi:hypothetical protein BOSEA31B_14284 [Hyphomicrobiales bacterium]|nr:hypothetical protein BOSEA31B_14284 [Hyphomicrobiales bacterium]CAH1700063.1 hypothetical protein BOSEA1005_13116 [Hyphomicrobiales bacterium]CAI0343824.1 hypothetical protein BO1005MUT1_300020 [Hyphomicrobiales bacterium]
MVKRRRAAVSVRRHFGLSPSNWGAQKFSPYWARARLPRLNGAFQAGGIPNSIADELQRMSGLIASRADETLASARMRFASKNPRTPFSVHGAVRALSAGTRPWRRRLLRWVPPRASRAVAFGNFDPAVSRSEPARGPS